MAGDGRAGAGYAAGKACASPALRPPGRFSYVHNGSLEGAALALLSRAFTAEIAAYLARITYINLSELPGYMDEFVGACFLPHTSPELLRL
jgi:uncharacterized 2Fe-2S/4Fe-4S cluster protein (DUF4445 family)